MSRNLFLCFVLCMVLLIISSPSVSGQNGEWLAQPLNAEMSGSWLIDAGESVAAVARSTARYVYFFDIMSSQWSVLDCGAQQNFSHCVANGHVALVFGQNLLVAYSGVTSSWDTIYFKGDPLDLNPKTGDPSYGCGNKLGWFVTTTRIYIFDAEKGKWKVTVYNPNFSYVSGNGRFWAGTNYAGIVLASPGTNVYFNAAYSLVHHNFSLLSSGGYYDQKEWGFDNGFVSYWNSGGNYRFFGYSAYTGYFEMLEITPATGLPFIAYSKNLVSQKTVFMVYLKELVAAPSWHIMHMYGFDTRSGIWDYKKWKYDEDKWDIGIVKLGGQFATINAIKDKDSCYMWIYPTAGESFTFTKTSLKAVPGGGLTPAYSGTVAAELDLNNICFYSFPSGDETNVPGSRDNLTGSTGGENYNVLTLTYPENTSTMDLVAFNSKTQPYLSKTVPYQIGTSKSSPWMTMFRTSGRDNEVFCYSGLTHNYKLIPFPDDPVFYSYNVKNVLASVETSKQLVLYDATANIYHSVPRPAGAVDFALGEYAALIKLGTNSVQTYSVNTGEWHNKNITENISDVLCGRYIGLITTPPIANKIYAYNGLDGKLIPLSMEGTTVLGGLKLGGLTAVITRNTIAYAFTPKSGPVSINSPEITLQQHADNFKVFPNPFNARILIEAEIFSRSYTELCIYDMTGREINRLVSHILEPGKYKWTWDGCTQTGMPLPSGFYIVQLKTGTIRQTRKIMYLPSGYF